MLLEPQVTLDILPPAVSARSLRLSPGDAEQLSVRFPNVALPASLEGAVPKRRLQYAAGRYCAQMALSDLGIEAELPRGADRLPIWPADVVGAISHTDDIVWAAVARRNDVSGVGVDVEQILSPERALRIHHLVSSPDELALARARGGLEHAALVTLIFSFKESLYKCLYPQVRRFFGYLDAAVTDVDLAHRSIEIRLNKSLGPAFPQDAAFMGRFALSRTHVFTAVHLPGEAAGRDRGLTTRGSSDCGAS
jgi:4'-phosphopantetheinyl transferase EntD